MKKKILTHHKNGQWCKVIQGKRYYFGTDYDTAVKRYKAEKDDLITGRERQRSNPPTLAELANLYVQDCRQRITNGDYSQTSLNEAVATIKRVAEFKGQSRCPAEWSPLDFAAIKNLLFEPVIRTVPITGGIRGPSVKRRPPITVDGDR